jgi:hypothetical protein
MNKDDLLKFRELLIKADNVQLKYMLVSIEMEQRKRHEVKMAQLMDQPYGNEAVGYRLVNGKRVTKLEHFDKSVYE